MLPPIHHTRELAVQSFGHTTLTNASQIIGRLKEVDVSMTRTIVTRFQVDCGSNSTSMVGLFGMIGTDSVSVGTSAALQSAQSSPGTGLSNDSLIGGTALRAGNMGEKLSAVYGLQVETVDDDSPLVISAQA